ncbi:electron transport complex subunit RsxC [Shewanella sp.]|uniref:electron transport complex subunit RsxC n=1 Tax=Shewanella sp. TaxID=50422 RepID=UPI0040544630
MLTLLEQLDKSTLWHSPGGIHPPELKHLSNQSSAATLALAAQYIVPVPQVGEQAILLVNVGDKVNKGQVLTQGKGFSYLPVHAPTSGEVMAIEPSASNHASSLPVMSCIIRPDGNDTWTELTPATLTELSKSQMLARIKDAGIAGMGGAAFPSHIKLNPASEIDLVIINGVECEPYITADDCLMREHSGQILEGIGIIFALLTPERIIIAIEDNKPQAASAMKAAIINAEEQGLLTKGCVRVTQIPTKYPSGGEKQLIQIITGKEVPSGTIPAQLGIVVHNVGTAFAIKQAVLDGKPLVERLVTITGERVAQPGNYWLPIGMPINDALEQTGFSPQTEQRVIVGGPMMGYALSNLAVPVLKGTNCLLAPSDNEIAADAEEKACIRCGECAVACPALLLPQQLFWHAKAEEYDKAASFNLKDCIECGCCSYVCPSDIPLVEYYRVAKSAIRLEAEEKLQAEKAKQRFETRIQRLEDEKLAREAKAKEAADKRKAAMNSSDKNAVAEAMARIAAKKAAQAITTEAEEASSTQAQSSMPEAGTTDKKSAVAAAIGRAKAKKAALAAGTGDTPLTIEPTTEHSEIDDKKAKVAAAVARAKAKKAALTAQANNDASADSTLTESISTGSMATDSARSEPVSSEVDDKKAKIAAAVARAKAKKAALAAQADDTPAVPPLSAEAFITETLSPKPAVSEDIVTQADDKKAKVAAAVANAKAKALAKKQQSQETAAPETSADTSSATCIETSADDAKKARIAAAVAKAKAKAAQKRAEQEQQED